MLEAVLMLALEFSEQSVWEPHLTRERTKVRNAESSPEKMPYEKRNIAFSQLQLMASFRAHIKKCSDEEGSCLSLLCWY